uniref:Ubiquitin-conjugating enzyme E2 J1 n=2 Tax=Cacopsylla melanoneura TaxID=428564 RepID=A0A8D8R3Q5_9HEMI
MMSTNEFEGKYNLKSPGVKRLMREANELRESTEEYSAHPLEDNLFEWHFSIRGPPDSEFEGGIYHGRIILPNEYPMKPPNIILLTPNGRFEINTKICLSISGHHPETWQPSWSIRTALLALIAFMPTPGSGTAGSLDYTPEERKVLARKSQQWSCSLCGKPQLKDASEINNAPKPEDEEQTQSSTETENIVRDSFTDDSQPINSPEVSSNSGIASTLCIGVLIVAIMAIIFRRIYLM